MAAMLRPSLYQYGYEEWLGTVHTAHYRPTDGRVSYHWPGEHWVERLPGRRDATGWLWRLPFSDVTIRSLRRRK